MATHEAETPKAESLVENMDWDTLAETVKHCQKCPLHETRTQTVFGVGRRDANLLIIGEAPGMNEDKQGEPFVEQSGSIIKCYVTSH